MSLPINPIIFREYDIRGNYGKQLTLEAATAIGRAFGTDVIQQGDNQTVCIGFDGRLSSPALRDALVDGLQKAGCDVIDIGLGPTPLLYFASFHLNTGGAMMITGSHNGPEVNGFKLMLNQKPFCGAEIQGLADRIARAEFAQGTGSYLEKDIKGAYLEFLQMDYFGHYPRTSNLRVAWDPGNGATGEIISHLIPHLPGTHFLIHSEIDGTFPNHHPDPTVPENMRDLQKLVADNHCDLGIAFDGDGDRIGAVTASGQILYGEHLLEIFAQEVLGDFPQTPIIADVKTSTRFFNKVKELGGEPVMWCTGHSHIKNKMRALESPLGGEMSGHIFFADRYYGFDDAIYAALRLLGILNKSGMDLGRWYQGLPQQFATPEIRIDCADKRGIMKQLVTQLEADGTTYINTDGIRVEGPNGWWLLRASNTQEIIVARAEANSQSHLKELIGTIENLLQRAGHWDPLPPEAHA